MKDLEENVSFKPAEFASGLKGTPSLLNVVTTSANVVLFGTTKPRSGFTRTRALVVFEEDHELAKTL